MIRGEAYDGTWRNIFVMYNIQYIMLTILTLLATGVSCALR